jgi:hypothetical protein
MNNFHYHQDPLYAAASSILGGTTPLNEGVEDVKSIINTLKVGDTTNFGKVLEIGPNSITFKAKDLPKTTIAFNQRKMGSSEFLLLKTIKLKEETELTEAPISDTKWKVGFSFVDPWGDGIANSTIIISANDAATAKRYAESDLKKKGYSKDLKIKSATKITEETEESLKEETDYMRFKQLATLGLVDSGELPKIIAAMKAVESGKEISQSQKDLIASTFMALIGVITGDTTTLNKLKQSLKSVNEAYKPLRKPADLIDELQSIVDAPDSKLWDVTSVSIRLSHEDIFDRFPKIYDYVEDMWFEIMQPNGAKKTKEIAKKAIEAVRKYYPDLNKSQRFNPVYKEEESIEEETIDEAINWLGDYLTTSEKSQFGGYRPTILDKKTKRVMYQSAAAYNTPQEAKDHAEDYLKQKAKGIRDPKVPVVGTYKRENKNKNHNGTFGLNHRPSFSDSDDYGLFGWLGETDEKMDEGSLDSMTLEQLWDKHEEYSYYADQGYGHGQGSIKNGKAAAEAIFKFVKSKFGAKVADDMEDASQAHVSDQEYDGTSESKNKRKAIRKKHGLKEEAGCSDEKMDEAADAALKRRKQVDMARVNAGVMSRDDYNKKYKLGKYRPAGSKLSGPGGLYKNLVKEEETLEEAVPTPAIQKLITSIDMLSPKDYLVFLQALADNAQGIANMSQAGKDGKSNANAWKTVADHISTAADAYAKRPVRLENTEVQGETLEEAANIKPVQGKYIFFIQDRELYQLDPYKLLAKTDFDRISSSKLMSHMKLGSEWKAVSVAWGTDLLEIGALESPKDISDAEQWYVVPHLYDKITHLALVH